MQARPHQWTHHHTHRLFHLSVFLSFVAIICSVIAGQLIVWVQTNAATEVLSISANVGGISDEEPASTSSGSGGVDVVGPGFPAVEPQRPLADNLNNENGVFVSVDMAFIGATYEIDSKTGEPIWVFDIQYPEFRGRTTVPNTTVYIEIHSPVVVRSAIRSNQNGDWSWSSPVPLSPGAHTATFAVQNPNDPATFSGVTVDFVVRLPAGSQPAVPPFANQPVVPGAGDGQPSNVQVVVPETAKVISPGQEITVNLRLDNLGTIKVPADAILYYIIRDANGKIILQSSEKVSVYDQALFVKKFTTANNLASGLYTITVLIPTGSETISATETFEVRAPISPVAGTTGKFPSPEMMLLVLFVVFVIFAYIELHQIAGLSQEIAKLRHPELNRKQKIAH